MIAHGKDDNRKAKKGIIRKREKTEGKEERMRKRAKEKQRK